MTAVFSPPLLHRLAGSYSIKIETTDQPTGRPHRTTIWVAVDEPRGRVYVRSVRGDKGRWYRRLLANPDGAMVVGNETVAVTAVPASGEEIELVSELLSRKYPADQYLIAVLRPEVLPTTLRLAPRKVAA